MDLIKIFAIVPTFTPTSASCSKPHRYPTTPDQSTSLSLSLSLSLSILSGSASSFPQKLW